MGMTDSQFKQFLRSWQRLLEEAKAQDTKEEVIAKIEVLLQDIQNGLQD